MSQDTDLERWEITTAVIGLRGAHRRAMDAYRNGLIPYDRIAGVSVAEFVFWACALDERLEADPAYAARRDGDEQGQILRALRFTRDRHTHQIAITTSLELSFDSPDLFRVMNRWRPLDLITEPTGRRVTRDDYKARRTAYEKHLEGRKPALAMGDALEFLTREVAARGIEVHDPSEQV